ncbi:bifunctional polysaccharide deacetylase/glycosyltransferase family 2 protein [Methanosarcina sp. 2.H.A.1B.4]|uniref:bifunctional polysaccharide deacetylase/glycosyltransferase family 2 protein n=1 Tax=Methanosarcina sp. 2.H.A.1B.4 TaxID=1483600 RepID=UPI000621CAD6|nr:bifunctional polysaccharide deacetylase/glycosyltransferase family 2 protein [Methanosarcina sp. 2.H.A.1B.4]KKG08254.1 hypothetical protein EO92_06615 [Methanosarcina sp. 2.H.A.1B.4]
MAIKIGDHNKTDNVHTTKSIELKSDLYVIHDEKYWSKTNISNKDDSIYKNTLCVAMVCALVLTISIVIAIQTEGEPLHNLLFGEASILDASETIHVLQAAQNNGVTIGMHGWAHENYSVLSKAQIKENIVKSQKVFRKAGFKGNLFVPPYKILNVPMDDATKKAIESTGVHINVYATSANEYTWRWRNMKSFNDPEFIEARKQITLENPETIILHAQDWNQFTKQFVLDYLNSTDRTDVIIQMDDIDANTPTSTINDLSALKNHKVVAGVILAVIPASAPDSGDPGILGVPISSIMRLYFILFITTVLFPMSLIITWKLFSDWYIARQKSKHSNIKSVKQPELVSVIVPAYNEEKAIERCINALLNQDYTGAVEIIVVNDGSTDRTAEIVSKMPVKFINLAKNISKANALNVAIEVAKGDIVLFSDGDSNMERGALRSIVKTLIEEPDVDIVTGTVLINPTTKKGIFKNIFMYCQVIEYHLEQEVARGLQALNGKVLVCPGPITAVKRAVLSDVKFSDDTIVEDADFTVTALEKSMKVIRDRDAKVYTDAPETITEWIKQRNRWWYGSLQVWRKHKKWAISNPWMLYNYMGYITSIIAITTTVTIPILLMQYGNRNAAATNAVMYMFIPVVLYMIFNAIFLTHNKKLIPVLVVYMLFYTMLRLFVCSYLYIFYITDRGLNTQFGARKTKVK